MRLLCIDPGTFESGVVLIDTEDMIPIWMYPKIENNVLLAMIEAQKTLRPDHIAIEMIASYGMPVGKEVFETCVWIGRFMQAFGFESCTKIYRKDVKLFLCGTTRAKDGNVRQALFDLYEPTGGGATPVKGTKKQPGPLYGLSSHAIPALAVGHTFCHQQSLLK